ncbi:MAG: SIS domain-containing protein [Alistipes sp.]|nr:SIS domain-containing protein [Alistipes sp.]
MTFQHDELLAVGRKMIHTEVDTLTLLAESLDDSFIAAVEAIYNCTGKVVITGMGKSGIIARKIAATLTSTGTPTIFLHPAEASHGDLGIIAAGDVVIALSYSGETDELRAVVEYAERNNNTLIAMTGNASSSLARHANVLLNIMVQTEDCVLDIVPTSSTTAQLAMGDAIATVLMHMRGFQCADFAQLHPGGYIERRIKMNEENNR